MAYTKYKDDMKDIVYDLIANKNFSDKQCIETLGISKDAFYNWLNENSDRFKQDFYDSYKKAKQIKAKTNIEFLEEQTNKHITGYFVEEVIEDTYISEDGNEYQRIKKVKKWISGNGTVLIHEKKNADPNRWNEKQFIEHSGEVKTSILDLVKLGKVVVDVNDDTEL